MPRSRSSIFSFDTLALSGRPPKATVAAAVTALVIVVLAEIVARVALYPLGAYPDYWSPEAAIKFQHYRDRVRTGNVPELLVVGDSTAARNIDPTVIAKNLGLRGEGYSLAWPANFPKAFRRSTLPLLSGPDPVPPIVVASFTPAAFQEHPFITAMENGILSCPLLRASGGEWIRADDIHLTRLLRSLPYRKSWFTGKGLRDALPPNAGFLPLEGQSNVSGVSGPTAREKPGETPFTSQRFDVFLDLARAAKEKGIRLFVVIMPRRESSRTDAELYEKYYQMLNAARGDLGYQVVDLRRADYLTPGDFWDAGHLNRRGAVLLSQEIAHRLSEDPAVRARRRALPTPLPLRPARDSPAGPFRLHARGAFGR